MSKQQAGLYEPLPVTPRSYARPGGPSGYGAAVWPPPVAEGARGGGLGRLVVGVATASLILLCTLLCGFLIVTDGDTRYELTAPDRVGAFHRDAPLDRTFRKDHLERLRALGVREAGSITAGYSSARGKLMFSGLWGTVKNPERAVDGMFEAMAEDARREPVREGAREETVGRPERVSADDAVMKCQPVSFTPAEGEPGASLTLPYCVWADHSTLGVVGAALGDRTTVPDAAEVTGALRRAARVRD
ncbi:hypothetical protein [Streptomyces abikoensis]